MGISQIPQAIVPSQFGSQTLISTTNLSTSGTDTTISNIPQSYKDLKIIVRNVTIAGSRLKFRPNSSSSLSTTRVAYGSNLVAGSVDGSTMFTDGTNCTGFLYIYDYANTTYTKQGYLMSIDNGAAYGTGSFNYNSTTAITSLNIHYNGTTPSAGSVLIYGVN